MNNLKLAFVMSLVVVACAPRSASIQRKVDSFDISLEVLSDDNQPVPGAELFVNYESVGKSPKNGSVEMKSIRLAVGTKIKIDSRCPNGYHSEGSKTTLFARRQASTPTNKNQPLKGTIVCTATHRLVVLSIKVGNLSKSKKEKSEPWYALPVMINNRKLAMTNKEGTALIAMKVKSDTEFDVMLDTSAFPKLEPQNPSAKYIIENRDKTLGFTREFEMPEEIKVVKKKKKKKKKKKVVEKPTGPRKLQSVKSR